MCKYYAGTSTYYATNKQAFGKNHRPRTKSQHSAISLNGTPPCMPTLWTLKRPWIAWIETLWKVLAYYGIPEKIIKLIRMAFEPSTCQVVLNGSEPFNHLNNWTLHHHTRSTRVLAITWTFLFLIVLDWIIRGTTKDKKRGLQWSLMEQLEDIDYADDMALISQRHTDMKEKLLNLEEEARKTGLKINVKKKNQEPFEAQPHKRSHIHHPARHHRGSSRLCLSGQHCVHRRRNWSGHPYSDRKSCRSLQYPSTHLAINKAVPQHEASYLQLQCEKRPSIRLWNWESAEVVEGQDTSLCEPLPPPDPWSAVARQAKKWRAVEKHIPGANRATDQEAQVALAWTHAEETCGQRHTKRAMVDTQGKRKRGRPKTTWRRSIEAEAKVAGLTWGQLERKAQDRGGGGWRTPVDDLCSVRNDRN